jgi:hypothetical protein
MNVMDGLVIAALVILSGGTFVVAAFSSDDPLYLWAANDIMLVSGIPIALIPLYMLLRYYTGMLALYSVGLGLCILPPLLCNFVSTLTTSPALALIELGATLLLMLLSPLLLTPLERSFWHAKARKDARAQPH